MTARHLLLTLATLLFTLALPAQNSKKVRALKAQQTKLQKQIKASQQDLAKTKKDVKQGQSHIHYLGIQLEDRLAHIRNMEADMDTVETQIAQLRQQITQLDSQLTDKKLKYTRALRIASQTPKVKTPIIFILSARNLTQMYRRARYTRQYAAYQYDMAQQIMQKQGELMETQNKYLEAKRRMVMLVREVMYQRKQLNEQQVAKKKQVEGLKQRQKGLSKQISEQQRQLANLNRKIDQAIAYEIEQARKRAEAEARRKAEAAARAAAERAKKQAKGNALKTATPTPKPKTPATTTWLTPQEQQLSGRFELNQGRLPVPLTGQYMIAGRFGTYNVPGLKNVQLDNKGTNYVGKPGARARSIFDGEVSTVFQYAGTWNVLVRHGKYISVYCNLSSVIVRKGQKVNTRDILGTIQDDGNGNCVLHFQLRKETMKLNPEHWIGR